MLTIKEQAEALLLLRELVQASHNVLGAGLVAESEARLAVAVAKAEVFLRGGK